MRQFPGTVPWNSPSGWPIEGIDAYQIVIEQFGVSSGWSAFGNIRWTAPWSSRCGV